MERLSEERRAPWIRSLRRELPRRDDLPGEGSAEKIRVKELKLWKTVARKMGLIGS